MISKFLITYWITGNDLKQYSMEVYAKDSDTAEQFFLKCFHSCNIISTRKCISETTLPYSRGRSDIIKMFFGLQSA